MNQFQIANIPASRYVGPTSRYQTSRVAYLDESKVLTFETYKRGETIDADDDKFGVIPPSMQFRPDLVSTKFYGIPDYWWKIMEANGINDVFDFRAGLTIRLPHYTF